MVLIKHQYLHIILVSEQNFTINNIHNYFDIQQ